MPTNQEIIFVHMPKCAGSSMKTILKDNFGKEYREDYESFCRIPQKERFQAIATEINNGKNYERKTGIVFGHFYPMKYAESYYPPSDIKRVFATFLRDPAERLMSHYAYWKRTDYPNHFLWRQMDRENWSFAEFALSAEMKNFYSQYFFQFPIHQFDFIGIHENIERDWKKLCDFLGIRHRELPNKNKSDSQSIATQIDRGLLVEIQNFHSEDYFLYNYAVDANSKII